MIDFIIQRFVKRYNNVTDESVRRNYKVVANAVMLIGSVIMFALKTFVSVITGSSAVLADAYLSIADNVTAAIRLFRYRGNRKKNLEREAPEKGEVILAFFFAFTIIELAIGTFRSVLQSLTERSGVKVGIIILVIYLITVPIKAFIARFHLEVGRRIKSRVFIKSATHARNDLFFSVCAFIGLIVKNILVINMDSLMAMVIVIGVVVSAFTMMADAVRTTLSNPDSAEYSEVVRKAVLKYPEIIGVHDIDIKDYGEGRAAASLYAEVSEKVDIDESRALLDKIEEEASKASGIQIVLHMNVVEKGDETVEAAREALRSVTEKMDPRISFSDFHVLEGEELKDLIFDVRAPYDYTLNDVRNLEEGIRRGMRDIDPLYNCIFTIERKK